MNALAVPFRQLVERRLWPLAVLLVIALAAVPVLLSKSSDAPAPAAPIASTTGAAAKASATQPIVTASQPAVRESNRRVLGSRKDPFRPAVRATKTATGTPQVAPGPAGKTPSPSGSSIPVISIPGGVAVPTVPKKTYELYSLTVRFGESSLAELESQNLKRLTSLPSVEEPVVIYLGLLKDLKTAVFLVDASATVQGDGRCQPHPTNCQTVRLKPGETAFFDVADATGAVTKQYQLDYVNVKKRKTTNARAARAARLGDRAGRKALRARTSRLGSWRYDAKSGTVKRLSAKALKAEAAARAARASS